MGALEVQKPTRVQIIKCLLVGMSDKEIASVLGVSESEVTFVRENFLESETQGVIDAQAAIIRNRLLSAAEKGAKLLDELIDNKEAPYRVRQLAADSALEKVGFGKLDKVSVKTEHNIGADTLRLIQQVLGEISRGDAKRQGLRAIESVKAESDSEPEGGTEGAV